MFLEAGLSFGAMDKSTAVARLVGICPAFNEAWRQHRARWAGKPAGEYNDLGALAHWVVDETAAGRFECFPAIFDELEVLLALADADLRDLLVVGFLEDVQNIATNRHVDPDLVLPFLGRETRMGWFELIRMWHGPDGSGWPGERRDT
jgi:hypothetical protein